MIAQFRHGVLQLGFEVLKPPGIFEHGAARIRQDNFFSGPFEQFLAKFRFEALQGKRNRGLRARELFRGA
jgi:hypothetical protein